MEEERRGGETRDIVTVKVRKSSHGYVDDR